MPYDEQQLAALSLAGGVLDIAPADMAGLAVEIQSRLLEAPASAGLARARGRLALAAEGVTTVSYFASDQAGNQQNAE